VSGLSVVIPSRNADNLIPCVEAIRRHEPEVRIIVVDDGLDWNGKPIPPVIEDCTFLIGKKPFVFATNCNLGIHEAGRDDVVLCNDDALLESHYGFSVMQLAAKRQPEYGLISATTNLAGNPEQHRRAIPGVRECRLMLGNSFPTVAFVCVLLPRYTLDLVGELDPIFTSYGWEDNDYCRRVWQRGMKIGISDDCFVDHSRLQSTFRSSAYAGGDISEGRRIYLEKWKSM